MNILDLFFKLSPLVKLIIMILISLSVSSWAIIIQRIRTLNMETNSAKIFEDKFWSGVDLFYLHQEIRANLDNLCSQEQIFYVGFNEFIHRYRSKNDAPELIIEAVSRSMSISMNREVITLESYLSFLGTVASVAPYIGLFGTVCGIMDTFIAFGTEKMATLQMLAPGIAEALITTGIALFAAIPALITYNYLNQHINKLEQNYNNFINEFISILHRQIFPRMTNKQV